ncbi:MAG: type III restriction endonuclease subunit R, partial [Betaproteobacteria bacterium]|nr:type III restriction endonuclease subunit R [Betaproteobacteria bacterium]
LQVAQPDTSGPKKGTRTIKRRPAFKTTEIYLPKVMAVDGSDIRELDYDHDVLSTLDWRGFNPQAIADKIPENAQPPESQLQRIRLADDGEELFIGETVARSAELLAFDPAHAVRMVSDIVPNAFVAREIVARLLDALSVRGFDSEKLGQLSSLIVEELRKGLDQARTAMAEAFFKAEVDAGRIQFRLRLDGRNWRMPFVVDTAEPENARQLVGKTGGPLERSLFAPVYEAEFNNDERDVAVYLDGEKALTWWHRNVARTQYGLQGWKRAKIYPDFIFAVSSETGAKRIMVLETKGDQLDNLDTAYKREVLSFLSGHFRWDDYTPAGQLELVKNSGETVQGELILMSEWRTKLPTHFQ